MFLRRYGFQIASWFGLAALLALWARFGRDAGVTWDEVFQREYGMRVLAWFRSGFRDDSALHYKDLYLYGGLFDMVAQWIVEHSPLGPYETRHMVSGLVAIAGIAGTWKLASMVGGARAGLSAALMLVFTPVWIGHGLFNPKDIPFGTAAVFAVVGAIRLALVPALRTRDFALAGLGVGVALAMRPGGVFLFAYPCLAAAGRAAFELSRRRDADSRQDRTRYLVLVGLRLAVLVAVAWAIMLSAWPWAQMSPIKHPLEAMRAVSQFDWNWTVLFDGRQVKVEELPRTYLLVWFGLSLPETYLLAFASGLVAWSVSIRRRVWRAERVLAVALIAMSVFLPLSAAIALKPVVYDAQRHFLFLLPPLAALSGIAISYVLASDSVSRWLRGAIAVVAIALLVQVGHDMLELHPYEYVYFNRLSGGLAKNHARYETDYWGASYREGLRWVLDVRPGARRGHRLHVAGCDSNANKRLSYYVRQWPEAKWRVKIVDSYDQAEIFLAVQRFNCSDVPGPILHEVRRQGVPLLYVKRTVAR